MILIDKNQSWKAPEGYQFQSIVPVGSFLQMFYHKERRDEREKLIHYSDIVVYLNDQGREVCRTQDDHTYLEENFVEIATQTAAEKVARLWWEYPLDWINRRVFGFTE